MFCTCSDARMAARLDATGNYRLLRRLDLDSRSVVANDNTGDKVGVCVDVETTGTDVRQDEVVELSVRRFRFDDFGVITKLDRAFTWLEEPSRPLDPDAAAINGLTDEGLRGQSMDDELATAVLRSACVRIAFNASFDRKFVERRLPALAGLPWACAMREVDWRARGFDGSGRSLGWILAQCGYYNDRAHRAAGDVDATIAILEHRARNGETALFELLERASQPSWLVRAVGASYDVSALLKSRGYMWDASDCVWFKEVADGARGAEEAWLTETVYAPQWRPRMDGPSVCEVTWLTRHAG